MRDYVLPMNYKCPECSNDTFEIIEDDIEHEKNEVVIFIIKCKECDQKYYFIKYPLSGVGFLQKKH